MLPKTSHKYNLEVFAKLSAEAHELIERTMTERNYEVGHTVLFQNDWGQAVYFVLEGWVKIRMFHSDGNEVTLNILGPDEIVGEMAALDQSPRSTDVLALTPLRLGSLSRDTFMHLLSHEPLFAQELLLVMARRLRQANRRLLTRESNSEGRLVDALLFIAEGQGRTSRDGVTIPSFPHRELAALSGLARETVTRSLSDLQKRGLVEKVGNCLRFPSLDRLEKLLGLS
ncbi:Crp/Fnr family transcriptional regulator [Candidatus Cyanaurora vandensis]|uniref:Crp/Fnr family transcriptional regulator n=1 Tax=Candidatus Cyanaurora vandensis TaxID=2714958 RepID=UPI002579D61D|nr:Crp/Fnr family transcriptional regulator [Candidatus Cyanaurora vandensis]